MLNTQLILLLWSHTTSKRQEEEEEEEGKEATEREIATAVAAEKDYVNINCVNDINSCPVDICCQLLTYHITRK